jgi:hypothetical protein
MRIEQVSEILQRRPFRPFTLRLKNGHRFYIPSPGLLKVARGRLIISQEPGSTDGIPWMGPEQLDSLEVDTPMVIEAIREAIRREPFRPFVLRLADQRELPVPHPEFIAISGRTIIVTNAVNEAFSILEPLLIVSLEYSETMATNEPHSEGGNP